MDEDKSRTDYQLDLFEIVRTPIAELGLECAKIRDQY